MTDWNAIYDTYPIYSLKELGHCLLDEYVSLDTKRSRRDAIQHAYEKLNTKLDRLYGRNHFRHMKTREEVIEAIVKLRHMIKKRQRKIEHLDRTRDVILPLAQVREIFRRQNETK